MQKKTEARTVGAVYTYTPCFYKISVQEKGSKLENKKRNKDYKNR